MSWLDFGAGLVAGLLVRECWRAGLALADWQERRRRETKGGTAG